MVFLINCVILELVLFLVDEEGIELLDLFGFMKEKGCLINNNEKDFFEIIDYGGVNEC